MYLQFYLHFVCMLFTIRFISMRKTEFSVFNKNVSENFMQRDLERILEILCIKYDENDVSTRSVPGNGRNLW